MKKGGRKARVAIPAKGRGGQDREPAARIDVV
jgi:hypothetical protein